MAKPVRVRYYRLKNRLKEKTAGLGKVNAEDVSFDDELLMKAEEALQEMAEDYPDWVSSLINQLAEEHRRCVDSPETRKAHFERIHAIAHDMKGQGGTFGYQLITDFADGLYNFTGPNAGQTDSHVEIIKAHIDAMRVVIRERIDGDGGEIGNELKESLTQAIEKYSSKTA
ncbi:hypothetical protein [Luteithermobacter gelatinilyticus]|uniref:hypothetical protein n=1 Tax=Luteithermobacter gelatinilyticus TaxID=2582913 RepID=UPI00110601FE|nr:hypothetical protein [Luteithermobacter gelatinilyticus]|tara:strand:+ start:4421 stop:4933 length:513 start_codon:yes stop_codon:yes gene_type:complete